MLMARLGTPPFTWAVMVPSMAFDLRSLRVYQMQKKKVSLFVFNSLINTIT